MTKNQNDKNNHEKSPEIKELIQQKIILKEITSHLEENTKKMEETVGKKEFVQKINELEQQKILLTELTKMLSENNVSVDEILTIISHEFKTPMVPVKAYVDMLLEGNLGELTESQKKKLKIVQNSISSLHDLVSNSLDSKKIELGRITMNKTETNLTKLIENTIEKMKVENSILFYHPNHDVIISCDAVRISQVLVNLIKNSLKVITKEAGVITVDLKYVDNESVQIRVKDNGIGILTEKLPGIFTKYYKTDASETRDDIGIGLGLYLSKQIIDAHDGKIWIESEVGKGTTINFILPRFVEPRPFNEEKIHGRKQV